MMKQSQATILVFALAFLVSGCQEDPEEAANRLFVGATSTISGYNDVEGNEVSHLKERKELLSSAIQDLDKIVTDFPSSSIAVKIASNQSGDISLQSLKTDLAQLDKDIFCLENIENLPCRFDAAVAEEIANISNEDDGVTSSERTGAVAIALAGAGSFEDSASLLATLETDDWMFRHGTTLYLVLAAASNQPDAVETLFDALPKTAVSPEVRTKLIASFGKLVEIVVQEGSNTKIGSNCNEDLRCTIANNWRKALKQITAGNLEEGRSTIMEAFLFVIKAGDPTQRFRSDKSRHDVYFGFGEIPGVWWQSLIQMALRE